MTETKRGRNWRDFIDFKVSAGSFLVLGVQVILFCGYIAVTLSTVKDLQVTVKDIQTVQAAMAITVPLQNKDIGFLTDGVKENRVATNQLTVRVGTLEQLTSGLTSDVKTLQMQYERLSSASQDNAPIRLPRH